MPIKDTLAETILSHFNPRDNDKMITDEAAERFADNITTVYCAQNKIPITDVDKHSVPLMREFNMHYRDLSDRDEFPPEQFFEEIMGRMFPKKM